MSIDGLSMSALAAELNDRLTGGRIDKIFQLDRFELLFWIRQPGENIRLLLSAHPEHARAHITAESPPNPPSPPAFCMLLRKHLEDGRISGIHQQGRDRVLVIDIDTRGEHGLITTKQLTAEIMGKHSNIIFMQDEVIVDAIRRVGPAQSRHRHVLPGRNYIAPPCQNRLDPLQSLPADLVKSLSEKTGPLNKALIAISEGLGPVSARECIFRAGLPIEVSLEETNYAQKVKVIHQLTEIAASLKAGCYTPTVVLGNDNRFLGVAAFSLHHLAGETRMFPTISEAVEFADKRKGIRHPQEKQLLNKLITAELTKMTRKQLVLSEELEESKAADNYRQKADIIMSYLHQITPGSKEVHLVNFYDTAPEQSMLMIEIDPTLSPVENANSYYQKYNKMKRAQDSLAKQLVQTSQEIVYLESLLLAADYAQTPEDFSEIRHELAAAGYLRLPSKRRAPQLVSKPLSYDLPGGFTIQIGKNNRQNDLLTMKQAKPDDIWLHTKDIPGSHVLIRTDGREPSPEVIKQAAQLAAYYSKARQSANVPVDYTKRRYVRKPASAKPGFVIYDHQHTIYVTPAGDGVPSIKQKWGCRTKNSLELTKDGNRQ